ncbi:hypothetical protein BSPWISOX_299, partial [uncultured Gammaproteobacteria bacterium]
PTFHPLGDFLNPALALLGQGLKKSPIGQKLDFANHLYLCKGLSLTKFLGRFKKNHIKICGSFVYKAETKKSEQLKNQLL